VDNIIS
jgi:hypothetical protein